MMAVIKESPSKSGQGYDDLNRHNEDTKHPTQLKTIFYYLKENVATTSMVSEATGLFGAFWGQSELSSFGREVQNAD